MSLSVTCPHCRDRFRVADKFEGKKIRCEECDEFFVAKEAIPKPRVIGGDEDDEPLRAPKRAKADGRNRPSRRRDEEDEDDDDKKAAAKKQTLYIAGGIGVAVLVGIAILGLIFVSRGKPNKLEDVAQQSAPTTPGRSTDAVTRPTDAVTRPNGIPSTTPPPPAKEFDGARTLSPPTGDAPWMAKPDPAPAQMGAFVNQPIPIANSNKATARQLLMSAPNAAKAVLLSDTQSGGVTTYATSLDLMTGKESGISNLGSGTRFEGALSPDGQLLLGKQSGEKSRLTLWNLKENRKLGTWTPYGANGSIQNFFLVGADRAITQASGKIVLWKLPEFQAVYVSEGHSGTLQISPGGKQFLTGSGNSYDLYEVATGERLGRFESCGLLNTIPGRAGFSQDGKKVVVMSTWETLSRWSVETGKWEGNSSGSYSGYPHSPIVVLGAYAMLGSTLYDWKSKVAFWTFQNFGTPGTLSPDGRIWSVEKTLSEKLTLQARNLPDSAAIEFTDKLAGGAYPRTIEPGCAFQLQISGTPSFIEKVTAGLTPQLEQNGFKSGPGGITVTITGALRTTGKQVDYTLSSFRVGGSGIGTGPKETIRLPEQFIDFTANVSDARGNVVSKQQQIFGLPESMDFGQNKDYQARLTEQMWQNAAASAVGFRVPTNQFLIDGKVTPLPLSMKLP